MLGVQALGVVAVIAWVAVTMTVVFQVIKRTIGLRVPKNEETAGLDIIEHGLTSSYADFMPVENEGAAAPVEAAVPVVSTAGPDAKLTKVVVVTRQSKFEELKAALEQIGITGLTVTQVLGCGMQKGRREYYRGAEVETTLLPKVKLEVVISKVPLELLIATVRRALYTGAVGDGKIFVYDVENVVKVRTGEEGYAALQDEN